MFCPRCGAEARPGAKYCSSCGADLPARDKPRGEGSTSEGRGGRLKALLGSTRSARLVTIGTILALAIAVIAFVVLPSGGGGESAPQDPYTLAADNLCVEEKEEIVAAGQAALKSGEGKSLSDYAAGLVPIAVEWRASLDALVPPPERADAAQELSLALRKVAVEAGALARLAREGSSPEAVAEARRVDAATAEVEQAIHDLGLSRCGGLRIELAGVAPSG